MDTYLVERPCNCVLTIFVLLVVRRPISRAGGGSGGALFRSRHLPLPPLAPPRRFARQSVVVGSGGGGGW